MGTWCYTTDPDKFKDFCFIPGFTRANITPIVLYDISLVICMYIYPLIIFLGTCFNILSICVFTRSALRSSTTAFLLITLAIIDTLALYIQSLTDLIQFVYGIFLLDVACKVHYYSLYHLKLFGLDLGDYYHWKVDKYVNPSPGCHHMHT